jgi:hypothetical protein
MVADKRALAGSTGDAALAADELQSVAHTGQPEMAGGFAFGLGLGTNIHDKAATIVGHRNLQHPGAIG